MLARQDLSNVYATNNMTRIKTVAMNRNKQI